MSGRTRKSYLLGTGRLSAFLCIGFYLFATSTVIAQTYGGSGGRGGDFRCYNCTIYGNPRGGSGGNGGNAYGGLGGNGGNASSGMIYCSDIWRIKRCVITTNARPGDVCFCPGHGYGIAGQ